MRHLVSHASHLELCYRGNEANCCMSFDAPETLQLSENGLSEFVPTGLFSLPNLEILDLSLNVNLSGGIPLSISLDRIKKISLGSTTMSGNLPVGLFQLVTLTEFSLRSASFDGIISNDFQNLVNIKILDLSGNNFGGDIPPASVWSAMINLGEFSLVALSHHIWESNRKPHKFHSSYLQRDYG